MRSAFVCDCSIRLMSLALNRGTNLVKERLLILGDVPEVRGDIEQMEQRYALKAKGFDFNAIISRVADIMEIEPEAVLKRGRSQQTVKARNLLCYFANRELGMTAVELSRKPGISQPTVSRASQRGERIVKNSNFKL